MPRLLIAVLACFALLLPVGGCYRYDAEAKNLTNQSVRVSLHKGRYQREISTAVLAPGASVGWNGAVNGPVFLRVMAVGESVDVGLPRRAYTVLDVGVFDGQLSITKTVAGESFAIEAACPVDCDEACCAAEGSEPDGDAEIIEIIEDIEVEPNEAPEEEMIELIELDDG